jgi:nucleotide-binding universal stress UspA family protein
MYKTILVAFDDSEFSRSALVESANWIKKHGGRIILVNAVFFDEEEFGLAPEQREKRIEIGKRVCYDTREKILSEFGITVESLVCEGEAPEVIVDVAQGKQADLIAMGTHGRKGLKRLLMGSVTSGVIVNSPVDVIVIKRPCSKCSGTYSSILLPFDGSDFSKKALTRACELSKIDGASITVLYVIPRYEEMIGFFRTESIRKSLVDEATRILDAATEVAAGQGSAIKTEIREGRASDEITKAAADFQNDLIVMGTYGWRGVNKAIMGSTTERVIMNAGCPILAVR